MIASANARWVRPGPYRAARVFVPSWARAAGADVAVLARYPVGLVDAARVVVLCHGLGGEPDGYARLGTHLATHGFAVLHPQFLDALSLAGPRLGLHGDDPQQWMRDPHARSLMHGLLFDPRHWVSRLERVRAVLDSLSTGRHLPVRLRADGVIVAGHSYGAYTAQVLAGARLFGVGLEQDFTHPAVAGGLLMSPQGSGDRGLTSRSWDTVRVPLLVVTATDDRGARGEGLPWRREPFDASRPAVKHLAVVRGGDHFLGGIPDPDGTDPDGGPDGGVRAALCALAVAFADLVHGDGAAGEWLASGPFATIIDHEHREQS